MTAKALLVVHGIGEQHRGATTEKLLRGLTAAFGEGRLEVSRNPEGQVVSVALGDVGVRFYEVYWADLLSREVNRGAMSWSTLPTLVWQPMLCRRSGLLPRTEYSAALVAGWLAALLPASLLAFPLSQGARFFAQILDRDRMKRIEAAARKLPFWERSLALADATAHGDTKVEEAIEGTVADIPNYMKSIARGEGPGLKVIALFHAAMRGAREDGCDEIHVLAHSLGTVVSYQALTGLGRHEAEPPYAPKRLYTIGSPLEKIGFFWPWTIRRVAPSAHPAFCWTNFYHAMDAVSGRLKRFQAWAPHHDVRLKGGGGVIRSHVVYERSPQFLGTLTEELFGVRAVPPKPTMARRLQDRALTAAENLGAPFAFLASLGVGLGLIGAVLLGGPLLVVRLFRGLGGAHWADRVGNGFAAFLLIGMLVALVRELRQCYRDARDEVARAVRSR
ncbi:MAG TPA: hypothetical protein VMV21_21785 [Vicinamibacteria bacterium]|nr:hypothetical protein [Vicinamibacteria bacterium]